MRPLAPADMGIHADGGVTSAARFSPDDKFSRHRVTIKKRYNILPTQLPSKPL